MRINTRFTPAPASEEVLGNLFEASARSTVSLLLLSLTCIKPHSYLLYCTVLQSRSARPN
jgi:hypothetical protein